jgi:hypothetical protein
MTLDLQKLKARVWAKSQMQQRDTYCGAWAWRAGEMIEALQRIEACTTCQLAAINNVEQRDASTEESEESSGEALAELATKARMQRVT